MPRALLLAFVLAATPASAFLEKFIDKQLEKQSDSWRREAIDTLAKGKDPAERVKAAEWLSKQTEPEVIAALASALSDPDVRVRRVVADGLWGLGKAAEPARPQLLKALDDEDPDVVADAAGALQSLGMKVDELVPARRRVLAAPGASISSRFFVARNLVGHEPPLKLLEPMLAYLEHATRGAKSGSAGDGNRHNIELVERALVRLVKVTQERTLVAPLAAALDNTRNGAIVLMKAIAGFEPRAEGWTPMVLDRLGSAQASVRAAALGHLRDRKAEKDIALWVPRAAAMLQDPDSTVRWNAALALGTAGGLAAGEIDKVVAALSDPDKNVRRSAAEAIGRIGEPRQAISAADKARVASVGRPALTLAMEKDADEDVRKEAKGALAKLGNAEVLAAAAPSSTGAAPTNSGAESSGMAVLRARKVTFEESSYFRALGEGDVELVRAFLDAGMSPKASLLDMGPPLRVMLFASPSACSPGQRPTKPATLEVVKLLLARGADPNGSDKNGNTALMEAASKGCDRELIRTLIKAGGKIDVKNAAGLTPFEMGLWMGHDGLEEFIAAGYRLPADKAKIYTEGYKNQPASLAMIRKAVRK